MSGEMETVFRAFREKGFFRASDTHGPTALYGGFLRTMQFMQSGLTSTFNETLEEIQSGQFARRFQAEREAGYPILSQAQHEKARTEIEESWRRVREEARNPVPIFCYPSGRVDDFGAREIETLERLGFLGALSAEAGFADPLSFQRGPQRRFEISRMPFPEDLSVIAQYAGGIERFKQSVRRRKGRHGASLR